MSYGHLLSPKTSFKIALSAERAALVENTGVKRADDATDESGDIRGWWWWEEFDAEGLPVDENPSPNRPPPSCVT